MRDRQSAAMEPERIGEPDLCARNLMPAAGVQHCRKATPDALMTAGSTTPSSPSMMLGVGMNLASAAEQQGGTCV